MLPAGRSWATATSQTPGQISWPVWAVRLSLNGLQDTALELALAGTWSKSARPLVATPHTIGTRQLTRGGTWEEGREDKDQQQMLTEGQRSNGSQTRSEGQTRSKGQKRSEEQTRSGGQTGTEGEKSSEGLTPDLLDLWVHQEDVVRDHGQVLHRVLVRAKPKHSRI